MSTLSGATVRDHSHDDPLNTVLDLVESAVRSAVDLGLEAPLRERMKRLLPAPAAAAPVAAPVAPVKFPATENELQLSILVGDLKRIAKLKMTEHAHEAAKRIRSWAETQIEAAKQGRKA